MAERYGFHGWNPPDMSDPQSLSDLGGGAINNDGRFVDGSGTAAGHARPLDELHRESAVHFLNTYDGDKPFCLIVALVNPHDVQEYPGRGVRGLSISPTFAKGGYRLEDFQDLPIDLPPNIEDDLSTKPSVHASFRQLLAVGTGHVLTRERQLTYARFYAHLDPAGGRADREAARRARRQRPDQRHRHPAHERPRRARHVARPHAPEVLQRVPRDAERAAHRLQPAALSRSRSRPTPSRA